MKIRDYLKQNNGKGDLSWGELAEKFNIHPEAARSIWRRLRKRLRNTNHNAKILIFDLETTPCRGYFWRLWKQNIHPTNGQLQADSFILCWSAKWLFEEKMLNMTLTPSEVKREDDSRIVKGLWELIDKADVIIAHHGDKFDIPVMNGRFLIHGLPCPSPYQTIDTRKHASKKFRLASNKLDYIGQLLGLGKKIDTGGFELWERCMTGCKEALKEMQTYCDQDVFLLEDVYLSLRPWIQPHPNLGLFVVYDSSCCPNCSSLNLSEAGVYKTYANLYEAFRCDDCGAISRKAKTKDILYSIPK